MGEAQSVLDSTVMQTFLALAALLAVVATAQSAAAPSIKDKIAAIAKKCAAETQLPAEKSQLAFNQEIPQAENEKCFLECAYRGANVLEGDKFNLEGSRKLVLARFQKPEEQELANKLIDTCSKEVSAKAGEKCSLGRAVRECFVKHGKTVNFFPSAA